MNTADPISLDSIPRDFVQTSSLRRLSVEFHISSDDYVKIKNLVCSIKLSIFFDYFSSSFWD